MDERSNGAVKLPSGDVRRLTGHSPNAISFPCHSQIARRLYERMGCRPAGVLHATGEFVLECALPARRPGSKPNVLVLTVATAGARRVFRHMRLRLTVGPHPARVIGVERGPPLGANSAHRARGISPSDGRLDFVVDASQMMRMHSWRVAAGSGPMNSKVGRRPRADLAQGSARDSVPSAASRPSSRRRWAKRVGSIARRSARAGATRPARLR